ncbi:MAG TPA: hypothetical protein VF158_14415 [Longimicrobiales bacterium]
MSRGQAELLIAMLENDTCLIYTEPDIDGDESKFGWHLWRGGERGPRINGPAVRGLEAKGLIARVDGAPNVMLLTSAGEEAARAALALREAAA